MSNLQVNCAICFSDFENGEKIRELHCCHIFHRECIDSWLLGEGDDSRGGHRTCPLCKQDAIDPKNRDGEIPINEIANGNEDVEMLA